jgi:N-acetylmuramoyl-L-alanine amidase
MGVIPYTEEDAKLFGRLMRAAAEEDGKLGLLMVGNVRG